MDPEIRPITTAELLSKAAAMACAIAPRDPRVRAFSSICEAILRLARLMPVVVMADLSGEIGENLADVEGIFARGVAHIRDTRTSASPEAIWDLSHAAHELLAQLKRDLVPAKGEVLPKSPTTTDAERRGVNEYLDYLDARRRSPLGGGNAGVVRPIRGGR